MARRASVTVSIAAEDKELEALEEEDDDFFSESESEEEINDADEVEDEE